MKSYSALALLILLGICIEILPGCKEIIEEDLSEKKVQLIAPSDSAVSSNYIQNLWWEEVNGALFYRLQIVRPNFDTITQLIIDTLMSKQKFTVVLQPGKYQWRVRAENGSSKTNYSTFDLKVIPGSLSQQSVLVLEPADNLFTNKSKVTFRWEPLFGAAKYRLQVDTSGFSDQEGLVFDNTAASLFYEFTFPKEMEYQWRLRAESDTVFSQWSVIRRITYDKTPPDSVFLISPTNNELVTKPVTLQWNNIETAARYKLYVYKSDSISLYNTSFPLETGTTSYEFNLGTINEKVFWKVSAVDMAENEGKFSEQRVFIIK